MYTVRRISYIVFFQEKDSVAILCRPVPLPNYSRPLTTLLLCIPRSHAPLVLSAQSFRKVHLCRIFLDIALIHSFEKDALRTRFLDVHMNMMSIPRNAAPCAHLSHASSTTQTVGFLFAFLQYAGHMHHWSTLSCIPQATTNLALSYIFLL